MNVNELAEKWDSLTSDYSREDWARLAKDKLHQQEAEIKNMQERMIAAEKEFNHMRSFFGCDPAYYEMTPAKPVAWMPIRSKHTRIQETKPDDEQNWIPLYLNPTKSLTKMDILKTCYEITFARALERLIRSSNK